MKKYEEIKFNLPALKGISAKTIEEHLKLYGGYVKNTNLILEKILELSNDLEKNTYLLSELHRRFAFEFGGMRNHEYYFAGLENGAQNLKDDSELKKQIIQDFGSFEIWLEKFKNLALTRGVGWAMLSWDKKSGQLLNHWVDEQHLGQLVSTSPILCLDMWEHAYFLDYTPAEKKKYIDAFFENLNWEVIEKNFKKVK
ncbi:MAG: Fe-Mn family superoxide dismutase [Candidatus Paceibacterota bacterium]|jgi:Fe-Mn family superoxide dismutase